MKIHRYSWCAPREIHTRQGGTDPELGDGGSGHLSWRPVVLCPGEHVRGGGLGQGLQIRQVVPQGRSQRSVALQTVLPPAISTWL